jgi:replicative DNA helicase
MNQDISLNKLPPQDLEAEKCVLGAILIDNDSILKAMGILKADDFYRKSNQFIFDAMVQLFKKKEPIDLLTVSDLLRSKGILDDCGGVEYLDSLESYISTSQAITHHSKTVNKNSVKRTLIAVGYEIIKQSYSPLTVPDEIIADIQKKVVSTGTTQEKKFSNGNEIAKNSFNLIEAAFEKKTNFTGLSTGFTKIDNILCGLQKKDLIILAARPGKGKTTLALDILMHVAFEEKLPCALFSLEMSEEMIGIKMISADSGVSCQRMRCGQVGSNEWQKLSITAGRISESDMIFVDDTPALTPMQIRTRAQRLSIEIGKPLGLIVVDYLQLMRSDGKKENRNLELTQISASLKQIAKEMNSPVVALSQLNRAIESRKDKKPILSDLRESGAIEQDADVVAFIYRDEDDDCGEAEIIIAKQRMGAIGMGKILFNKKVPRFENMPQDERL